MLRAEPGGGCLGGGLVEIEDGDRAPCEANSPPSRARSALARRARHDGGLACQKHALLPCAFLLERIIGEGAQQDNQNYKDS